MSFQPTLFLFMWGAVLRLWLTDSGEPLPMGETLGRQTEFIWFALGLGCPPLALLSWWLIVKSRWKRSTLAGVWLRFAADIGMFSVLVAYHITAVFNQPWSESRIFSRYIVGSTMIFCLLLVVRDLFTLAATEHAAHRIRRG